MSIARGMRQARGGRDALAVSFLAIELEASSSRRLRFGGGARPPVPGGGAPVRRHQGLLVALLLEDRAAAFATDLDRWNHELTIDLLPILGVSMATSSRARQANAAMLRDLEDAVDRELV